MTSSPEAAGLARSARRRTGAATKRGRWSTFSVGPRQSARRGHFKSIKGHLKVPFECRRVEVPPTTIRRIRSSNSRRGRSNPFAAERSSFGLGVPGHRLGAGAGRSTNPGRVAWPGRLISKAWPLDGSPHRTSLGTPLPAIQNPSPMGGEGHVFGPGAVAGPSTLSSPGRDCPYLFTTDEFYRLLENEHLPRSKRRVGLWEGRIYEEDGQALPPALTPVASRSRPTMTLTRVLPPGWSLSRVRMLVHQSAQNKAPLARPDRASRARVKDLRSTAARKPPTPRPGHRVFADTSLKVDTGSKLESYAQGGRLGCTGSLNLKDNVIHVFESPVPSEGRYRLGGDGYGPGLVLSRSRSTAPSDLP